MPETSTAEPIESAITDLNTPPGPLGQDIPIEADAALGFAPPADANDDDDQDGGENGGETKTEEETEAEAKTKADAEAAQAPPTAVKFGDTEVPIAEAEAAYRQSQEIAEILKPVEGIDVKEVVTGGVTYLGILANFDKSVEGASEVYDQINASFVQAHKTNPIDAGVVDFGKLNPAELDDTGKALFRACQVMAARVNAGEAALQEAIDKGKQFAADAAKVKNVSSEIDLIKAEFPEAQVDPADLLAWKDKHKTDDPVAAYWLEKKHDLLKAAQEKGAKTSETAAVAPKAPKGGDVLGIDPRRDDIDEMERKLARMTPQQRQEAIAQASKL